MSQRYAGGHVSVSGSGLPAADRRGLGGTGAPVPPHAAAQSENRAPTRVRVFEEGLAFGADGHVYAFGTERAVRLSDMWVLRYGVQLVAVPRRAMPEDCWTYFEEKLRDVEIKKG